MAASECMRHNRGQKAIRSQIQGAKKKKKPECQPKILYPANLSFKNEGKFETFPEKQKLRKSVTRRPALHEILKESVL